MTTTQSAVSLDEVRENADGLGSASPDDKHAAAGSENGSEEERAEVKREDVPPDGGYGWVCVAAIFCINAHTWGLNSSYGVFLAHYLSTNTFPGATRLEFAFIGGLSVSMALAVSPVATATTRLYGTRITLLLGVFFEALSLIGASFASKIWQLFLSQGVCFGWGMGFLFVGSVSVVPQWFTTRRSLANGIAASGSGLGGLIYSLSTQAMIENISLAWAFRILGIVAFGVNTACALLVRDRNKHIGSSQLSFDYRLFRRVEFLLLMSFGFLSMLAYIVLLFSLPNFAESVGMTAKQGSIIGAVLNLGQALGRPPIGYFSDAVGRLNMASSMTFLAGLFCLVIWTFATKFGVLVFFALIGGCVAGTFWAVIAPVTSEVIGLKDLPSALALTWIVLVLPTTFSEPIALEIVSFNNGSYLGAQLFTGFMYIGAASFLWMVRAWKIGELEKEDALDAKRQTGGPLTEKPAEEPAASEAVRSGFVKRMFMWRKTSLSRHHLAARLRSLLAASARVAIVPGARFIPQLQRAGDASFARRVGTVEARRTTTSSPALPSSPPIAFQHQGEASPLTEARGVPSPAQTLWTAHSPTQTLGHSSPELPPLPSLASLGGVPRTPSTVARHEATDSTYYTASWGSPYQRPPPGFNISSALRDHLAPDSDDLEEDASSLQFGLEHLLPSHLDEDSSSDPQFGLEHLLPSRLTEDASPNQFGLEHLLPSRLPINSAITPTRSTFSPASEAPEATPRPSGISFADTLPEQLLNDPTGDWVRQFLSGGWDDEKANWWSDESSHNDSSVKKDGKQDKTEREVEQKKKGHKSRKSNLTLKQQDFWAHFSKEQKEHFGRMMASKYADPGHSRKGSANSQLSQPLRSPASDKPLHPPPTIDAVPSLKLPNEPENALPKEGPVRPPSAPRPRKKLPWKGKACWIALPADLPRGKPGQPPMPLSSQEVAARMETFERAGYNTNGFDHFKQRESVVGPTGLAQARDVYPEPSDYQEERSTGSFRVRIPNKAEWEAYENYLMEQKLAALGVSMGGEEEEVSPAMSRKASSQYPALPFSPPLPTSSAGSQRLGQNGSVISGTFPHGPSPAHGHTSTRSIASPISPFGNQRPGMHMHRHSTFTSPANFAQSQPTPPGLQGWSPQQYFGPQGVARGGSPALSHSRPDLGDLASPASPFGFRPNQQFPFAQKDDLVVQMQQQQQQLQTQLLLQQQQQLLNNMRPSSTLAEVPEDEAEEDEVTDIKQANQPGPQIAVPTPRGHQHNISENLEREIRDAEYHLEQAIDKQLEEGGEFSTESPFNSNARKDQISSPNPQATKSAWEEPRPIQQVLHQPQPHNRAHSLTKPQRPLSMSFNSQTTNGQREELSDDAKTNGSEVTNPSLEEGELRESNSSSKQHSKNASQASASWKESKFNSGRPQSIHSKHTSTSSVSKLNVEAKEFKFNPSASFNPSTSSFSPNTSSFGGFSFQPTNSKPIGQGPQPVPRSNNASIDGLGSGLNVTAPDFKPSFNMKGPALPSSNFDFLSKGPTFKPDDPAFSPPIISPAVVQSPAVGVGANGPSKIFGNFNMNANDFIKPAKRSKAVPIVMPDTTQQPAKEVEDKEDEMGRITQADGREKRARHGHDDRDQVPQFAMPSHPLSEAPRNQGAKPVPETERAVVPEDKENLSPNKEQAQPKAKSPQPLSAAALQLEGSSFGPGTHTPKTDDVSDTASGTKTPTGAELRRDVGGVSPSVEEQSKPFTKKHPSKGSLSATAKPFEYRPQFGSGFDFGIHVQKPSLPKSPELDTSHVSSPRHVSRSPATTFRPSDDGSYKTAPEPRKHRVPYPESESVDYDYVQTFDEIDSVMKHLNEEGSDFGVERDSNSWDQSSPRRSLHDFERLQPNIQMRSDAPSPSPRRIYAHVPTPGTLHASSTSITHDPFSDERAGMAYESPVHRLNNADEIPVSDWDEGISSDGEDKIQTRSRFFDSHVDGLIGRLLQNRLGPLERNLQLIQDSISTMGLKGGRGRRSMSTNDRLDSDADDEDDDADVHYRNRSPRKDRRLEKIRAIVMEAIASQPQHSAESAVVPTQSHLDLSELHQALGDIKASITAVPSPPPVDLSALQEAIGEIRTSIAAVPAQPQVDLSEFNKALDEIRSSVVSAPPQPPVDISEFYQALGDVKASFARSASSSIQPEDFREMIEDVLKRQSTEIVLHRESKATEESELRVADLQSMVKEATLRVDEEIEARKAVEAREISTQRLLKVTEEELVLLREAARDDEHKMRAMDQELRDARGKIAALHDAEEDLRDRLSSLAAESEQSKLKAIALELLEEDLQKKLTGVSAENEALQFTLEEYRLSSDKWRKEIQQANAEKEEMKNAVDASLFQAEEAQRIRESMRTKLEAIQKDMSIASGQVSAERAQWQKSDQEHMTRYEILSARIEAEGRTRERLERELERLEGQEREGMRMKVTLEQTQKANARLEDAVNALRHQSDQHQRAAEKYERDYQEAREAGRVEVQRTRVLMEADIDVANNQVNMVRAEMEHEISRLRSEMDNVRMDANTAKARNELLLEEAADSKQQALDEALNARNAALQEQERTFERRVELLQKEHSRALDMAVEDKDRSESYLKERLSLSDAKLEHLQDKIAHLEEKVSVAQSAAQAAAQAAQLAKAPTASESHHGHASRQPEKISPQALRESIAVLQEQLQERETRIESLEHKLEEVDTEAPAKLKERETEIGWLRELLGVRVDDLSELINALAQPAFSREAVRDAAIRIRTNLQMEQQEKERLMTGGQNFPAIVSSLSSFATSNFSSPKAGALAAAAAFGNWRKGGNTSSSSLSTASASASRTPTPSRTAPRPAPVPSTQSFLSGLMTPPTSNLRRTPQTLSSVHPQPYSGSNSSTSTFRGSDAGFPALGKQAVAGAEQHAPSTPPLLRNASYDQDAEGYSENGYYDDEESTVDGNPGDGIGVSFEGFGPGLHR
ncbi:uncharacterized protein BDZ99DRAFT_568524 [Mytilinidion resinicola]|uniref:MFS general substrate transporter n=1 Tax=Mytilinidion resinicola TaxID=574789 RepID=A0A6A6YWW4_9PEZI|nr:uncharacterized protein BDZ99DRAFT_568524 [Mytilinidion resinicola]KAF2813301.1 hypothetical protein BDZ99DRAFT_568524 [Mytilinidion resinicola]